MDRKIANNLIVGVFVILGFVAFSFILFNIGGGKGLFSSDTIIQARFKHVKGLNYGSEVALSGLRAGVVKKITIDSGNNKELIAEISVSKDLMDKVRQDSTATIMTSGILGDKYIEISIGTPSAPQLKNGDFITSSEPEDLFAKSGTLMESISKNFNDNSDLELLFKHLNQVSINLANITTEIQKSRGLYYELLHGDSGKNINKATAHLGEILRKIDAGEGTIGALINDPTVYEDVKSLLGGAKRSSVLRYFMNGFIDSGKEKPAKK